MQTETVKVRTIEFGKGIPKLCVPITAATPEEVLEQVPAILEAEPDCIELRLDWLDADWAEVERLLQALRHEIGDLVLLATFRTDKEGGRRAISDTEYEALCRQLCECGAIDLLDVEAYRSEGILQRLTRHAHANGVKVVGSNHHFDRTPSEAILVETLLYMESQGVDLPKVAVMPESERDVITLLSATVRYYETGGRKPVITMSMGQLGAVSRLAGELTGSALTFATVTDASAPGQMPIRAVRDGLKLLHGQPVHDKQ